VNLVPASRPAHRDSIVIRSWPNVIFLYPVMLTAFICGTWQLLSGAEVQSALAETAGLVFFAVLCLNLLVISFEFSRFRTISIISLLIALFFLLLYLSDRWDVLAWIRQLLGGFHISASPALYFALGSYLLIVFVGVYINTRFNYWVLKSNEILHKEGLLGDVRRFPSPNLKMTKEISDVFEFLLLGSGRIVLSPASERQSIVLHHVLRVNVVEKAIQDLLSSLQVEIQEDTQEEERSGIGVGD
jgi:hypothetical protein